jgi:tetratricopeptide (TPR) repeat protein
LSISFPSDRFVQVVSPKFKSTVANKDGQKVYTWQTAHLEPKSKDADVDSPAPEEPDRASVQLTTFKNWDETGQWFRSLAAPRAAITPDIRQKAEELTRTAKTESEKIQNIYHYVSTNFRYIGIALGIGRIQPHSATDVLTNDYGDCKDKHTLFAALLAAVGVKAYPTLISSTGKIDPAFPSISQFDHVITALPRDNGFLFLDTTPEVAPFGYLIAGLRDKQVLVLPDDGPAQLVKTPPDPPFKSFMNFEAEGTLNDADTFDAKMQITLRGDAELLYRYAFRQAGQPQWKDVMQKASSLLNFGGTVSDVVLSPLDATDAPFHIEYNYNRKEFGDWENRRITLPCPPMFLPDPPAEADAAKHLKAIELGSPFEALYRGSVKLPSNSYPHLLPSLDLHEAFADYHTAYSVSDGVLHFERHLTIKSREVTPSQFESYRKFTKAITDDETTFITLRAEDFASAETSDNPEAREFYKQGAEAWRRNDLPQAAVFYQKAVEKDPKFAGPMYWLGAAHVALGDSARGIEEMKKSITLDPAQVNNYDYLCATLVRHHRENEALDLWKQLLKINPDASQALENEVRLLFSLDRYSEAISELEAAAQRNPDVPRIHLELGQAYAYSGNSEKSIAAFQKAVEADSSSLTLNNVAFALADNNIHLDDALKYAQKAVASIEEKTADISLDDLLPDDVRTPDTLAAYWDTLGWTHFRLGHFETAEKYLHSAWLVNQASTIGDHLGQVYEKLGKKQDAAAIYSAVLSLGSAPPQTKARLDALRSNASRTSRESLQGSVLQDMRTYKLGRLSKTHTTAEFYVLLKSAGRPTDVKFISGSQDLSSATKPLGALKFNILFPDTAETQILQRGILDCEPELPGCVFVLIPPSSVQFTKLPGS